MTRKRTMSIYSGTEPRRDELTAHWPKKKIKRRRFPLPKRKAKRLHKDKLNKHANERTYQARLAASCPLYTKEGDH
jgi:hypothetical protein